MNQIGTIQFNFQMQNETFASELYARWDSFFAANFERIADEVLGKLEMNAEELEIHIDRLELDLGNIPEQDFDRQFPLRVREKLEEAVLQWRMENGKHIQTRKEHFQYTHSDIEFSTGQTFSTLNFQFLILEAFLLHGTLPWNTPAEYKNISHLFLSILRNENQRLKQFLLNYGHYTSLQERLVYQLNDLELEKGVQLLEPANSGFICSYVHVLHAKYKQLEQPELPETAYRNTVWLLVYTYLLNNRSSYFDKKAFLSLTILRLSAKNNLSYDRLLEIITRDLESFTRSLIIPSDLFKLLKELRNELSEKQFDRSAFSAAKFYKTICGLLQKEIKKGITEQTKESLIRILSRPDSSRIFLQPLKEEDIYRLVEVVIPHDSQFIIETAKSIDTMESEKTLNFQFSTLNSIKWQLMFPLLLENKGATFNRKYFVENVFKQVAAHYNLAFFELLASIYENPVCLGWFDNPLKKIIEELYKVRSKNATPAIDTTSEDLPFPTLDSSFSEQEHYEWVRKYVPNNSEFIITYAKQLDAAHEKGFLEGQTSGEFRTLKWRFIFTVLAQLSEHSFSRRYFVEQTLQRMVAHYNLNYADLLAYFQTAEAVIHLPFELHTLLTELFHEEKEHWIYIALHSSKETDKFNILKTLFPVEEKFITIYVQALGHYHEKGGLQGKTSGNFHHLKWKFVFEILFESQKAAFNKKQFIERTLAKLASHYNLAMQDVLSWFCSGSGFAPTPACNEIVKILNELYNAQKTKKSTVEKTSAALIQKYLLQHPVSEEERVWFERLSRQTAFITYIAGIMARLPQLRKFLKTNYRLSVSNTTILQFLLQTATRYHALSQVEIWEQLLEILTKPLGKPQRELVMNKLAISGEKKTSIIKENIALNQKPMKTEKINHEELAIPDKENSTLSILYPQFVNNAGMVLLSPYFSRLFGMMNFVEQNTTFKNRDVQIRALFLLQYAVFGHTEFPEHEMTLNKLLTAFDTGVPIPKNADLTDKEKETVEGMLKGALQNWPKLSTTSIGGLREAFLQREGKLEEKEDYYLLTVQEKAYDLLLDSCPWNFKTIKYSWMKKMVQVKWR